VVACNYPRNFHTSTGLLDHACTVQRVMVPNLKGSSHSREAGFAWDGRRMEMNQHPVERVVGLARLADIV